MQDVSEQLQLGEAGDPTWTVGRLNAAIARAVHGAFPDEVWVRGEVQSLSRSRRGHTYFDLVEVEGRATRRLDVVLLAQEREHIRHQMVDVPDFDLANGVEVRIRGRIGYFQPTGNLQLNMTAVDPFHTVGAIAAQREVLLRRLRSEGITEANRRLALPDVPLVVGLVTAADSAAYNDVARELGESSLAFRVVLCDARMQGHDGPLSVVRALRALDRRGVDVVVVARGGGSMTDLAAFDDERIARAIAGLGTPVITGIGHEVDTTVADEVAHTRCKTPTACAALLVHRVRTFRDGTEAAWTDIVACARRRLDGSQQHVDDRRRRVARATSGGLRGEARRLQSLAARVSTPRLLTLLDRQRDRLDAVGRRAERAAIHRLDRQHERVAALADRARLLDPVRTLQRGYSVTRAPDGTVLRSVDGLTPGSAIITTLADGRADSTVDRVDIPERPDGERMHQ